MYIKRIRDLRIDNDMTQQDLAQKLNLHLTQYCRYERGESDVPNEILIKLAKIYNVTTDYILGLSNNKNNKE